MLINLNLFSFFFVILFFINLSLSSPLLKKISILIFSLLIIFLYNPYLIVLISFCCLFSYVIIKLGVVFNNKNLDYLILLLIIFPEIINRVELYQILNISIRNPINTNIISIGISFLALKFFLLAKNEKKISLFDLFYLGFFIPTYVQGPIHSIKNLNEFSTINYEIVIQGIYRISISLFKLFVVVYYLNHFLSEYCLNFYISEITLEKFIDLNIFQILVLLILNFLILYFNFSGYVDLSIGISLLLGITLPENFNNPLISKDISEFWTRWHMTLASFVRVFIYIPLLKRTKFPRIAIILTFLCLGIWHKFNIGYIIWGLGHGLLLAFNKKIFVFKKFYGIGNRFILILLVSILSFFANYFIIFY